jgi:hypothetical protein
MKIGHIITCAMLLSFCYVGQNFGWYLKLTNWTKYLVNSHVYYSGCKADHQYLQPGETKSIDAHACLNTSIDVEVEWPVISGVSYRSSGQRTYDHFYIVGPVNGMIMVGRIEELPSTSSKATQEKPQ